MCRKIIILSLFVYFIGFGGFIPQSNVAMAQSPDVFNNSGLPIPRFVSLRNDKVYVRTGPALRYPLKWVYRRAGLPVEIIQEFDTWRKIRDRDGEEGWIHQSLLSGKRTAVVVAEEDVFIHKKPNAVSKKVAIVENGNIISLEQCDTSWCEGEVQGFSGFISRNSLWGVYQKEELE